MFLLVKYKVKYKKKMRQKIWTPFCTPTKNVSIEIEVIVSFELSINRLNNQHKIYIKLLT